jgi:WD40 repeat protein
MKRAVLTSCIAVCAPGLLLVLGPRLPAGDNDIREQVFERVDDRGDALPDGVLARVGTTRLRGTYVSCIAYSPDGSFLASGGALSNDVLFWDPRTGKISRRFVGHRHQVNAIAFSRDGKFLASAGQDSEIILWRTADGQVLSRMKGARPMTSIAVSSDGTLLASAEQNNAVRVWDVRTGTQMHCFQGTAGHHADFVTFSRDGKTLAAARTNHVIDLWDVPTWRQRRILHAHQERVISLAFSPDRKILYSGGWDSTVRYWGVANLSELRRLGNVNEVKFGSEDTNGNLALAPDGSSLIVGRADGGVSLIDTATGKELHRWRADREAVRFAFAPDGRALATTAQNGIRLWDAQTGRRLDPFTEPLVRADRIVFSPDGKFIAVVDAG